MRSLLFVLASILLISTGCQKTDVAPTVPPEAASTSLTNNTAVISSTNTTKIDTEKQTANNSDTDTSNPDYWYNGTKGTAIIKVTCKDCTAIATIGDFTLPFMFNADGVGMLKYTPAPGLLIKIAVCPAGAQALTADILDSSNKTSYSYAGVIPGNWSGSYLVK